MMFLPQRRNTTPQFELHKYWCCSYFGEIVSASGFGPQNIFVEYVVDLPDGWFTEIPDDLLNGATQKCYPDRNDVAHISCPFQFDLNCDKEDGSWPQLLVRVVSIDIFGSQKVEGYGVKPLPRFPGRTKLEIITLCEVPTTPIDKLSEYFLGDWDRDEDDNEKPRVTETRGTVILNINCIMRITSDELKERRSRNIRSIQSINDVIEAFEKAKQKMISIKERFNLTSTKSFEKEPSDDDEPQVETVKDKSESEQESADEEEDDDDNDDSDSSDDSDV